MMPLSTGWCEHVRVTATFRCDCSGADHSMDETLSMSMHGGSSSSGDSSSGTASEIEALFEDDTSDTGYD